MIKNDIFLRTLNGEKTSRPPVWMMRQAGRYLPDFMKLRAKYDFFTRCQTPELATEITIMPVDQIGVDAAILFSDILVIPKAMGVDVDIKPNFGPILTPIKNEKDIDNLLNLPIEETLDYVMQAVKMTKRELNNSVPLIGFAGAPWTIMCYMIQGQGSKTFDKAKAFCFTNPIQAHRLLQKITDYTIRYLKAKVDAGCDAIQLFDSWGGMLSPNDYDEFSWKYNNQIIEQISKYSPTIMFGKGCWYALDKMAKSKASAIGIDWTVTPQKARELLGKGTVVQGNFDPTRLLSKPEEITRLVTEMIDGFGHQNYIANLGHGILPNIPVENAKAFVNAVKNYKKQ